MSGTMSYYEGFLSPYDHMNFCSQCNHCILKIQLLFYEDILKV